MPAQGTARPATRLEHAGAVCVASTMNGLQGLRILAAEDELLVAMYLEDMLNRFGCEVLGPFATVTEAVRHAAGEVLDGAVLDINMRGESVFPAAVTLLDRGVPFVFCSGYADLPILPERLKGCPRIAKPYSEAQLRAAMETHFIRAGQPAGGSERREREGLAP
jgi:CheY-like chemotaxis protein